MKNDIHSLLGESARLEALRSLDLSEPHVQKGLDRLAGLVREVLNVPVALVSLVDERRQYFPGCVGLPEPWAERRETPLSHSFCQHVVVSEEALVIEDSRRDERVRANLAIRDLNVIAYLGVPLRSRKGLVLGSLCAIDHSPRRWTEREIGILRTLAESVIAQIELQRELEERRRAEEARDRIDQRFRNLVRESRDWIWETDADGLFTFVSPKSVEMIGYGQEELLGRSTLEFMETEEATRFGRALEPLFREGRAFHDLEKRMRRKDGAEIVVSTSGVPLRDESGALIGFQGITRDITSRKQIEEELDLRVRERTAALERANVRYRSLFEHNPHAVYAFDLQGNFTAANSAVKPLIGVEPDELVGTDFLRFVAPDARERAAEIFQDVLRGEPRTYELPLVTPTGERLEVQGVSVPLIRDGVVEGVIGVAEDVTRRRSLEAQLRQSQKMQAVGQLAGGIAHDFNNLITGIRGFTHLLLKDGVAAEGPVRDDLLQIDRAAERAADLTRQLLTFSRTQVLDFRVVDLNDVLSDTERMLRRVIGPDITMETRVDEELPPVLADPGQLEQVIVNLVVNARDAMPEGGTLTLRTRRLTLEPQDLDRPAALEPGAYVALSVSDTGMGMSAETRERVFEPFFTTKESGRGTGLGLSTVFGIVEQSGGHVRLESELGRGTTFEILLPVTSAAPDTEAGAEDTPVESRPTSAVVLVVEDEPAVRSVIQRILTRQGYTVLAAPGGAEALMVAEEHSGSIDILLTDLLMPGMGGQELATRLNDLRPDTRVLFMSGVSRDEAIHRRSIPGGTGFVGKPFTPQELLEGIEQVRTEGSGD